MKEIESDLRYKILNHLKKIGHTTEEVNINPFLSSLKTHNGKSDLGTILESLKELKRDGYIKETRNRNIIDQDYQTKNKPYSDWKSPERFVKQVGDATQINNVYIFLTLEGKKFIIEWEMLENNNWLLKNQRINFYVILAISFISVVLSVAAIILHK